MKRITITICTALFLLSCNSEEKKAEEPKTEKPTVAAATTTEAYAPVPDSIQQKNWAMCMMPGKEHELMASWNGTWNGEVSLWMKPGEQPTKSTTVAVNSMILGGRYQQAMHKGNFAGMPFEGRSLLAYDNAKKLFVSTWIDNMGTGIMNMEGTWDQSTKSMTLKGRMIDPATLREGDYREVMIVPDADHQVMEMYGPGPDGKEFKSMEIKYSRKK
jgi:hypothetical protein